MKMILKPKLSIVMPTLNVEKYIRVALESIIRQTFNDWELIIMDGGSVDGTIETISSFKHPNIKIYIEKDEGPFHAITNGFKKARGDYFMSTTGTDGYIDNNWFRTCVDILELDITISLVWGIPANCSEDGKVVKPHVSFEQFLKSRTVGGWLWRTLKSKFHNQIPDRLVSKLFQIESEGAFNSNPYILRWISTVLIRKLFRLGSDDVQKQNWFDLWLDTALCFPDLNMCYRRFVYEQCIPPLRLGGRFQDEFGTFFFNFNEKGFLPFCVPRVANFGRIHEGQISTSFKVERQPDIENYFRDVHNYAKDVKRGRKVHLFRDGSGNIIK